MVAYGKCRCGLTPYRIYGKQINCFILLNIFLEPTVGAAIAAVESVVVDSADAILARAVPQAAFNGSWIFAFLLQVFLLHHELAVEFRILNSLDLQSNASIEIKVQRTNGVRRKRPHAAYTHTNSANIYCLNLSVSFR